MKVLFLVQMRALEAPYRVVSYTYMVRGSQRMYLNEHRSTSSTWATSSDARVKENITDLKESINAIMKLHPVSYNYTSEYVNDNAALQGTKRGFIAQEVKAVLPDLVTTCNESFANKTIEDFNLLNPGELIPIMISAIQEQQKMIESQKQRIDQLEEIIHTQLEH